MYCCGECSLQSETTITAVVLISPNPDLRKQKLKQLVKEGKRSHDTTYRQKELLQMNKENKQPNNPNNNLKTRRKSTIQKVTESFLFMEEDGAETGRFNGPSQPTFSNNLPGESSTKRNCESKTTSFGSRKSSAVFFRQRELDVMQEELKKLREEELLLHKEKLQKAYLYNRELREVQAIRDQLQLNSSQRQSDLSELRQLLRKHKQLVL